jgi:hypothetical protein
MAHNNDIDKPTYKATFGIVFFATPHGGGNRAGLADLAFTVARAVALRENNSFMTLLKKNTFFAEQQRDDFLQRTKDFEFLSFYETLKTSGHMVSSLAPSLEFVILNGRRL